MSLSKLIIIITIIYLFLNGGAILINVGAILYGNDFEMGAILINVGVILTGAILQWGDLTRYRLKMCLMKTSSYYWRKGTRIAQTNVIKGAIRILQTYCLEKNFDFPYDGTTNADLNTLLTTFFTAVRTKEGKLY